MSLAASLLSRLYKRRSYLTVEPALFLYMFAGFLSYPAYQQLLFNTLCHQSTNCTIAIKSRNLSCDSAPNPAILDVQAATSHWVLYTNIAISLPSVLLSLIYGGLSDICGRKPFIIIPAIGTMLNSVIVLIVQYTNPNGIGLYLIGGVISGLAGGLSVFNLSCYSYVADISSHGDRTSKIGWLESMTYFGATISSLVGGVWIMNEGIGSVYLGIIGCLVSVIFYVILFLPPSVSHQSDLPTINQGEDHHPFYSVVTVAIVRKLCRFMKLVFSSWRIVILLFSFFILEINFLGITDLVVLYSITRLCWSSDVIGYFLASKNLFNGLGALIILPVLSFLKFNDVTILVLGLTSGSIALIIMGVADHSWVMALAVVIGCMRGSAVPIIRSMLSKLSPPNQQGVMFSGLSIIEAFCMLAASSLYNALYPVTYPVYPGLCFFMMSLCVALLIPLICLLYTKHPTNIEHDDDDESKNLLAS